VIEAVPTLTLGAAVSMVTLDALVAVAGPVFVEASLTERAASLAITVPSEVHTTVTVMDVPNDADGSNEQPAAVPVVLAKSSLVIPVTLSEKDSVYVSVRLVDGVDGAVHVAVGSVASIVILVALVALAGPWFAAASLTERAASLAITVPSEVHTTVTVMDVPNDADGSNEQPVAVPVVLAKSSLVIPLTLSEKDSVYVSVRLVDGVDGDVHDAVGLEESMVTVLAEAADKLPATSTAYALYVPSISPVAAKDVAVLILEIVTLFHVLSAALVMLARLETDTVDFTR